MVVAWVEVLAGTFGEAGPPIHTGAERADPLLCRVFSDGIDPQFVREQVRLVGRGADPCNVGPGWTTRQLLLQPAHEFVVGQGVLLLLGTDDCAPRPVDEQ